MKRRAFLGLTGAAAARLGTASLGRSQSVSGPPRDGELRLAGISFAGLRERLYDQLFQVLLPFWDKHGIDQKYGGLMCGLDYDGTLLDTGSPSGFLGAASGFTVSCITTLEITPSFWRWRKRPKNLRSSTLGNKTAGGRKSCRGKGSPEALQRRHRRNVPPRRRPARVRCQRRRAVP